LAQAVYSDDLAHHAPVAPRRRGLHAMARKKPPPASRRPPIAEKPVPKGDAAVRKRASGRAASRPAASAGSPGAPPPRALAQRFHVAEVAASFGVRPRTVRSWIEKGLLEREKVGNAVFIRADQIEAMLSRGRKKKDP
jgi:Helix-turn-helix domain